MLGFVTSWLVASGLALLPRVAEAGYFSYAEHRTDPFWNIGDRSGPALDPSAGSFLDVQTTLERRWVGAQEIRVFSDPHRVPPPTPGMYVEITSPWWAWSVRRPYVSDWFELLHHIQEIASDPPPDHYTDKVVLSYGFPLMSHEVRATYTHSMNQAAKPDAFVVRGALTRRIPPYTDPVWSRVNGGLPFAELVFLPYAPLWWGLAINTVFYALLFWLVVATVRAHRQLSRLRRGRCPVCRYDLRYDLTRGCPECGWRRDEIAHA